MDKPVLKFLRTFGIVAACAIVGYGVGLGYKNIMKANEKETSGYVGPSTVKVENGHMSPEVMLTLGRLSDPQLSPDGKKILYGVSYTSIEANKSCRNLFLCDADGSNKVQLTRYAKSVSNARWSLDGKWIYFLQGGQMWKAAYGAGRMGKKIQISDVPAGIGEFSLSPDQTKVIYISTVPGPVKSPADSDPALDKAQAFVAEDLMYRHWDHWVTEIPHTFIAPFSADKITAENSTDLLAEDEQAFELPTEPFGGCEQLSWSPDGKYIAYSCRKLTGKQYAFSTDTDIYVYDVENACTRLKVSEGGGYDTDPAWSPDGSALAWISMERDGYEADRQRILVAAMSTEGGSLGAGKARELTEGYMYDAAGLFWTPDSRSIIFPSTIDGLGALCRVNVDGEPAQIARLTPEDWWFNFGAPFSFSEDENGCTLLASYQSMEFPTELVKVGISASGEATRQQITSENDAILSQVDGIRMDRVVLKTAQGEDLYCWVLYPPKFDAEGSFPAVEMFNGGPQTSLDQGWSYRWNFRLMAQQGYVVILPNRHGDSGFGQPWKEQISGDYQGLNMQDYMLAGRWAKEQKWCSGIAGVGASYGGFSVYNMMGIHGDLYDCFISHAGIFSERQMWYTTEESWFANWDGGGLREFAYEPGKVGPAGDGITFGGLQQAGAPYAKVAKTQYHYANDPETKVCNWHTPLLCIHGMMDFRIPYEQGMAAFNAAQMMGVPSKLVIFPEECHWVLQPQNALFWHREFFGWLDKWLRD